MRVGLQRFVFYLFAKNMEIGFNKGKHCRYKGYLVVPALPAAHNITIFAIIEGLKIAGHKKISGKNYDTV
jgi:hypothetical protein